MLLTSHRATINGTQECAAHGLTRQLSIIFAQFTLMTYAKMHEQPSGDANKSHPNHISLELLEVSETVILSDFGNQVHPHIYIYIYIYFLNLNRINFGQRSTLRGAVTIMINSSKISIHRFIATTLFRVVKEWPHSSGNIHEWPLNYKNWQ